MKGQAFIVFKDSTQSTEAMRAMQHYKFMGKEITIQFAKGKSDVVSKRDGTFNALAKKRAKQKGEQKVVVPAEEEEQKKKSKKEEVTVNNILKATELSKDVTSEMLQVLFKQYPGYIRAQMVAEKSWAFIEFDTEEQATTALKGLSGFTLSPGQVLNLGYAQ